MTRDSERGPRPDSDDHGGGRRLGCPGSSVSESGTADPAAAAAAGHGTARAVRCTVT